jgi:hypothetical protein
MQNEITGLYCPICGERFEDRVVCPNYGCGHPKLITWEDFQIVNEVAGKLLSPDGFIEDEV